MELSKDDIARIERAVAEAEGASEGEIVACLAARSDAYGIAFARAALVGAATALLILVALSLLYEGWGLPWLYKPEGVATVAFAAGLAGALVVRVSAGAQRAFVGRARMQRMTRLQAYRAFVEEEVFRTRRRTGVLLFVSAFEHRVELLADRGISAVVPHEMWTSVVDNLVAHLRDGKVATGFETAVAECGRILREHGLAVPPDDSDELPNALRIREDPE